MSQCVPNWDVEEAVPSSIEVRAQPCGWSPYVAMSEYEMAELTWENGQLSMHGLGLRRGKHVQNPIKYGLLERPRTTAGTLESIVNLATQKDLTPDPLHLSVLETDDQLDIVPSACASACACACACAVPPPPTTSTLPMDALVPTAGISTCGVVDSCSGAAATCQRQPTRAVEDGDDRSVLNKPRFVPLANHHSLSVSTSGTLGGDCWHVPSGVDTCDRELSVAGGFTSTTSFCSQGNTFSTSARTCTDNTTTVDDHDSVCHTRPPKGTGKEEERKRGNAKSSSSNRRSRAAAIHNQSERKRRDKINQKMKTLQKMVPNANKTDKASMLDEVIDYLKQLQAQVNMMSRMSIPSMMMPQLAMQQQQQQQLQMSMMAAAAATAPMGMGMGLGMGMGITAIPGSIGMDINMNIHPMARQNLQAFLNPNPPFMPFSAAWPGDVNNAAAHNRLPSQTATAVIPTDPISTYLACQPQPVTVEAYSRMIAMLQQQQQLSSTSKH